MNRYAPGPDVGIVAEEGIVYVAILPAGPIVVLDGVASLIWSLACAGPASTIVDRVAAATDVAPSDIRSDVDAFVDELVRLGVLIVRDR